MTLSQIQGKISAVLSPERKYVGSCRVCEFCGIGLFNWCACGCKEDDQDPTEGRKGADDPDDPEVHGKDEGSERNLTPLQSNTAQASKAQDKKDYNKSGGGRNTGRIWPEWLQNLYAAQLAVAQADGFHLDAVLKAGYRPDARTCFV